MYRTDPIASNPFACVFIYLVNPPSLGHNQHGSIKEYNWAMPRLTTQEKFFVSQLISSPSKDLFKKTPSQILQMDPSTLLNIDISGLQVSIVEKLSQLPHSSRIGIPCILSDIEPSRYGFDDVTPRNGSEQQKQVIEALLTGSDAPFKKCTKPEFIRLAPPLHIAPDELIWLDPIDFTPEFAWDNSILNSVNSSSNISEIRKLIANLVTNEKTLSNTLQNQIESALTKNPTLVLHIDLTPSKFANLVEVNPQIAFKILMCYQNLDSSDLSPYLEELLKMKMSVHSMEVVNKLAKEVILPEEFIHLYISNCISKCENMNEEPKVQHRLARLLCVFIQSLIRNHAIDVKDLYIELQPFCMEFNTIKEANVLFRTLKSIYNENSETPSSGSAAGTPTPTSANNNNNNNNNNTNSQNPSSNNNKK